MASATLLAPAGIHDPDVAVIVHVDPVRPLEQSGSELREDVPLLIELKDDVQVIVADTGILSAAIDRPDGLAVGRNLHQAGRTP